MLPESKKEIEPLIKKFKKKMKEKGIPEKAIDKILELQEMNVRSKSRKIKDREERKKFEVQYFKDFLARYERWTEDINKAVVE